MKNYLYLLVSLLVFSAICADVPVQASRHGAGHAGQMKNARMTARANRRQARSQKFKAGNQSLSQSDAVRTKGNRNRDIEVENDETHWVGHDRTRNRQRRRNQNRTETVDNNETISRSPQASGTSSLMEEEGIFYFRKKKGKGQRRLRNSNLQ